MDLKEIMCDGVDLIQVAQDRVQWRAFVNMEINLEFHKVGEFIDQLSDCQLSKDTQNLILNCLL
jgi:hypothetical protein